MAAESAAAAAAASTTYTGGARREVIRSAPRPRARALVPPDLLLRRADHAAIAQLPVADTEIEAALGVAAGPRLERDGSTVAAIIAQRQQDTLAALAARRQLRG